METDKTMKEQARRQHRWRRPVPPLARRFAWVLGVVALLILPAYAWASSPVPAEPWTHPVDPALRDANTVAFAAMTALGVDDPYVDVTPVAAQAAYSLPGARVDAAQRLNQTLLDRYQAYVLGALAQVAPWTETIAVTQHVDGNLTQTWSVPTDVVVRVLDGGSPMTAVLEAVEVAWLAERA